MDQHPSPIARLSRELGDSGTNEILPPTERNLKMLSEGKLEELKPCPFCGSAATPQQDRHRWDIECNNCGARVVGSYSLASAIAAWNTRAQAPAEFSSDAPSRAGSGADWRPVETAPCDDRPVLLSAATWEGEVACRRWDSEGRRDKDLRRWDDPPTHWMPAPKPLASQKATLDGSSHKDERAQAPAPVEPTDGTREDAAIVAAKAGRMSERLAEIETVEITGQTTLLQAATLLVRAERVAKVFLAAPVEAPCERCQGNGEIVTDWETYLHPQDNAPGDAGTADCPDCGGRGIVEAFPAPVGGEVVGWRVRNADGRYFFASNENAAFWRDVHGFTIEPLCLAALSPDPTEGGEDE